MEYIENANSEESVSIQMVMDELDISRPTASNHLNRLEEEGKISHRMIANKKFWYSETPEVEGLDSEQIQEAIEVLRDRLADLRDPTISEVAAEIGENEESKHFREKFKKTARNLGWFSPKEDRHDELKELLKTVIVMQEGFKRSPYYPSKNQHGLRDRANEYLRVNEDVIEKIEVEEVEDSRRNDLYRAKLPYELKMITGKDELLFSAF